jgi:transcriptional regulator with XRE-family HTH domain
MELNIGQKIKKYRLASDLTQEELATRAGLTKGFISQLENDQTSIQIDSLADIVEVFGVTLSEFFSDENEIQVVYSPEVRVLIEGKGVNKFELLVPGSTNNLMDPILVELNPGERTEKSGPHPGEQFGYVLSGTATLKIENNSYKIPEGHCFYFESYRTHQIINNSDTLVTLLWIISPPQM